MEVAVQESFIQYIGILVHVNILLLETREQVTCKGTAS
jgi:hypothetical protein